jgi:hypothetical protein
MEHGPDAALVVVDALDEFADLARRLYATRGGRVTPEGEGGGLTTPGRGAGVACWLVTRASGPGSKRR